MCIRDSYSIVPMDRQERDRIKATLDRCKGLKVKVEQVFSPYAWTCSIYVFDLAEWEACLLYTSRCV